MPAGYVDPENLLFARERSEQVREVVRTKANDLTTLEAQYAEVFRRPPFHPPRDMVPALRQILAGPEFRRATESP
jgi:3-methyladenine DNA glycosylase/8-oxoguanine DNA glycosylase